jgi:TPR repeat protein
VSIDKVFWRRFVHILQYPKGDLSFHLANPFSDIRFRPRWVVPAIGVVVLVLMGVFGHPVAPREEADWLSRLAEGGDAAAQLELGLAYRAGRDGLDADPHAAFYWLNRSAKSGNSYAADLVGTAYSVGEGTAVDEQSARHWWQVAAEGGNRDARRRLGGYTIDPMRTAEEVLTGQVVRDQSGAVLEERAKGGDPVAEYQLAMRYRDGAWGVDRDPVVSRQWLERAAADGNPVALNSLSAADTSKNP